MAKLDVVFSLGLGPALRPRLSTPSASVHHSLSFSVPTIILGHMPSNVFESPRLTNGLSSNPNSSFGSKKSPNSMIWGNGTSVGSHKYTAGPESVEHSGQHHRGPSLQSVRINSASSVSTVSPSCLSLNTKYSLTLRASVRTTADPPA